MPTSTTPQAVSLPDEYLPASRVRSLFAITDRTMLNWIASGKLPRPIKIGNRSFFDPRELQATLDLAKASSA